MSELDDVASSLRKSPGITVQAIGFTLVVYSLEIAIIAAPV